MIITMNKEHNLIAFCTDLHFGANKFNYQYWLYQKNIIADIFSNLKSKNITELFILGDLFDQKKIIDIRLLSEIQNLFRSSKKFGINITILIGNHDCYYSNSEEINSIEIFKSFDNIKIISQPEIRSDGICICPWLSTPEQEQKFKEILAVHKPKIVLGHFEIKNSIMGKDVIITKGMDIDLFSEIPIVLSGHIHIRQTMNSNFHYIGVPYDINWGDNYSNNKGFLILDSSTLEMQYVQTKNKFFQFFYVTEQNYVDVMNTMKSNPHCQFKLKLSSEIEEFKKFIEEEFNHPENIKAILTEGDQETTLDGEDAIDITAQDTIQKQMEKYIELKYPSNKQDILLYLQKLQSDSIGV